MLSVCLSVRTGCSPRGSHVRLGSSPDKQYILVYEAFSLGFICACDTTLMSAVMLYRLTTTGKKEFGSSTAPMIAPAPRPTPIQHVVHRFIEAFLCVGTSFVEAAPLYALMSPESVSNSVKPMLSTATLAESASRLKLNNKVQDTQPRRLVPSRAVRSLRESRCASRPMAKLIRPEQSISPARNHDLAAIFQPQ